MDNPGPPISSSSSNQIFQPDGTIVVPEPSTSAAPVHSAALASTSTGVDPSEPAKRRRGRPKGSSKKGVLGAAPAPPKIKRPVGRPRKDGFPAGSVGPSRPKVKRDSSLWASPSGLSGVGYPPMTMFMPATSVPPPLMFPIDANLEKDEWADLARDKPNAFLGTLLNALAAPNPVSSAGPTVEEAFKSHLGSLTPSSQQTQPIPSLYSILKTFWLPSSPSYFSLTASASTARTPSEHRFLYWDPQPLVFNGISCPVCSQPLLNKGRISSGPIKIYDIEKPFFIIGCEYVCRSSQCTSAAGPEGRKFASTDASILRSLPIKLQDEFPARLMYGDTDAGSGPNIWNWKAFGVSRSLWNMVRAGLKSGLKKEVILHLVYSIQHGVPEDGGSPSFVPPSEAVTQEGAADNGKSQGIENELLRAHSDHSTGEGTANQSFGDAYNNAWKENAAVIESSANKAPEQPSTSTSAIAGTPASVQHLTPAPATHPYPPPPQYPPYPPGPYAPYAFFQTALMNAGTLHPSNNSIAPTGTAPFPAENGETDTPAQNKRSPRHCCKCGSHECKGKGGRSFCPNPCQDCGKLDCKGRNSRRPDKKCSEGWV